MSSGPNVTEELAVVDATSETFPEYPVSLDGRCPYCHSSNVQYLVLVGANGDTSGILPLLLRLLDLGLARTVQATYEIPEPPSFSCLACNFGFNLDFSRIGLKTIYAHQLNESAVNTDATSACPSSVINDENSITQQTQQAWNRDVTQWRATQLYWGTEAHSTSTAIIDPTQITALDLLLNKIDGDISGAPVASMVSTSLPQDSLRQQCSMAVQNKDCAEFKDYIVSGNFSRVTGRYSAQSSDMYWEKKGVPTTREGRLIAHFMDPSQLVKGPGDKVTSHRKKRQPVTREEVKKFKEQKRARQEEKNRAAF